MRSFRFLLVLTFSLLTLLACTMHSDLPRNMDLKGFDPHRAKFECKHEVAAVPPIDPEAEQWFQQGMAATSRDKWEEDRDYKLAAQLWAKAVERKHWKALINLANAYAHGEGVPRDTEKAVQLLEQGMKLGIPMAYDVMGTYHMEGLGVKQDASRAYAFWQLAVDMGSPSAQAYIGKALRASYDNPQEGFWSNRKIGLQMLECGVAQGNGAAALALGVTLNTDDPALGGSYARALQVMHEGVKFGSADCAGFLAGNFSSGEPMVGGIQDVGRADRYYLLADALLRNPDLRFPNLDKVLPLPPAQLPKWDGKRQTLIDAAKAVQPLAPPKPTAASQRTGRAHMPDGLMLARNPQPPAKEVQALPSAQRAAFRGSVASQLNATPAAFTGYWLPEWRNAVRTHELAFNRTAVPQHYRQGETFDAAELQGIPKGVRPPLHWHYLGLPVAVPQAAPHPRVVQGIARPSRQPVPAVECKGHPPCPRTGIWIAQLPAAHAKAGEFNAQLKQTYLEQGQPFPAPQQMQAPAGAGELTWVWMDNANDIGFAGFADLTLTDLHDSEGKPLA